MPSPGSHTDLFTELPVRLYSALRTIRIYPPSNPQVAKSTEYVIDALKEIFQHKKNDITIGSSEQKILINGKPLSEKDQQRPQIHGLVQLFETLQIRTLTFRSTFSSTDCGKLLEVLATASGQFGPQAPVPDLLRKAGLTSVNVDETQYVAIHKGERVAPEERILPKGSFLQVSDAELVQYVLAETADSAHDITNLSTEDLQRLFTSASPTTGPGEEPGMSDSTETLKKLIQRLDKRTEPNEKKVVLDRSAAALAGLNSNLLARLLTALPKGDKGDTSGILLEKTVEQLDTNRLEELLIGILNTMPAETTTDTISLAEALSDSNKSDEIQKITTRIQESQALIGLAKQPTPSHLLPSLQQPNWSAPVLVTALRQLAGGQQKYISSDTFTNLLGRYEKELSPTAYNQVASMAGARIASLDDDELGTILVQRFKGIFGRQLYGTVIAKMSDEKFESIAQELNLLAQKKINMPLGNLNDEEVQAAYQRLMQTVRGEKLQAALALHQQQRKQEQQQQQGREQVREKIKRLLGGDLTVLVDDHFIQNLPTGITQLLERDKQEAVDHLLTRMVSGLRTDDSSIRRGCAESLGRTAATLAEAGQWQRLDKLLPALTMALPFMEDLQAGFQTLNVFERLTRHHIEQREYNRAVSALDPIFDLTVYADDRTINLAQHAQNCLDRLADPLLLDPVLENIQSDNQDHDSSQYLISRMGSGAANFLLTRLGKSEIREERELLLNLIEEIGKPARNALLLLLEQDAPWYITRNIIRLFRTIGDPDCFTTLAPYIHHEDIRVDRELVQTIGIIGGQARKHFFLQELPRASAELQPLIVRQLGKIHDEGVVLPLSDLLIKSAGSPHPHTEELQTEICIALVRLRSRKAVPALRRVVETKDVPGLDDYSPAVITAAESALHAIESETSILDESNKPAHVLQAQRLRKHDPLAEKEAAILRKAAKGSKKEAKQELYDLVISCAKNKDFSNAERLRERIYEIDPMALTEIIRSGEFIEKEKTGAISPNQLETWAELLEKLDSSEFSAIYHELEERTFASEEIIVRQGDQNDELFFINQGSIKVSYSKDGRDIFVSTLLRGQIVGENFFDASFWTVTLTALTPVNVSVLKSESFHRWQEAYPGLENKLWSFYTKCNTTCALLKKKRLDRRQYERTHLSRKIQIQLIDTNGKPIGRGFRGELADISLGGLSYLIRISKKENTRLLLGRTMRITIPIADDPGHLLLEGLAIGVQPFQLLESDFSVHLKFPEVIDHDILQKILG